MKRTHRLEVPRAAWLEYASRSFNSIELNGTFYSLKSPDVFRRWRDGSPPSFVFAVTVLSSHGLRGKKPAALRLIFVR